MRKILIELELQEPGVKEVKVQQSKDKSSQRGQPLPDFQIFYKANYVEMFASTSSSAGNATNVATIEEHVRMMVKWVHPSQKSINQSSRMISKGSLTNWSPLWTMRVFRVRALKVEKRLRK